MKTFKKISLAVILLVCTVGISLTASGMIFVTSNVVHVGVHYTIALSQTVTDNHVALTATVRNDGKPASGVNVVFYYSLNGGVWTYLTTQSTNHGGVAHAKYIISDDGAYDFKAIVSIP